MPKLFTDIVTAVTTCFHLNAAELLPKFVVLRSDTRRGFIISTLDLLLLNKSACPTDDWQVAVNLSSEDLMRLMGFIPRKPLADLAEDYSLPDPRTTESTTLVPEGTPDARTPQNL